MRLELSIEKVLAIVDGTLHGSVDCSLCLNRITSLEKASEQDLAVIIERGDASVFEEISHERISKCRAGLFLASTPVVPGRNYILVPDAVHAFEKLVQAVGKNSKKSDEFNVTSQHAFVSKQADVHESVLVGPGAVISAGAKVGQETEIGAQVFVGRDCIIGNNVTLHPGVKILDGCYVGDYSIIHGGTVVGSDGFEYKVTRQGLFKVAHVGNVSIGCCVEIGANCSIDRALFDSTVISDGVKIDNNVHIAHNVIIGPCSAILAQTGIAGSVKIGAGCQIGGQVAIKNGLVIGNGVKIVSKSGVLRDLKDGEIVAGIPAVSFMQWKRQSVLLQKMPEFLKNISGVRPKKTLGQKIRGFFGYSGSQ
jgi:UDP-3-O-[3-hydroxymyristoyl] glucosamine N-acyltransferase